MSLSRVETAMSKNEPFKPQIKDCPIGPSQLRAARSMLDWSRSDLAKEAKLSAETIKNIEHGIYSPKEDTIKTLVKTFERHGIQFIQQESIVSIPAESGQAESILVFSHVWISRMTVSVSETKETDHD